MQYKNVNVSPVWIPVIHLPVCQRATHPLAMDCCRGTRAHTHTHTDIADCHSRHETSKSGADLCLFRSSVRHWMPVVPAKVLSGCSRCECFGWPYLYIFPPGSWSCLPANGLRFRSESPPVPGRGETFPAGRSPNGGQTMKLGRARFSLFQWSLTSKTYHPRLV